MMGRPMDRTRAYFESRIRRMEEEEEEEEDGAKVLPPLKIVNYHGMPTLASLVSFSYFIDVFSFPSFVITEIFTVHVRVLNFLMPSPICLRPAHARFIAFSLPCSVAPTQ